MKQQRKLTATRMTLVVAGVVFCAAAAPAAEKPLRWKLKPGEVFDVRFAQQSETKTSVLSKTIEVSVDMTMDMRWQVASVDQDGSAQLKQSFTRLSVTMNSPNVGLVKFDTASDDPLTELAEPLADSIEPLIGAEFVIKMSNRGEILAVTLSDETLAVFAEAPVNSQLKSLFTKDGLSEMLRQSAAVLPEQPVDEGATWESQSRTQAPVGTLKQTNHYTHAGTEQREGKTLDKITVRTMLELVEPKEQPAAKLALKQQQQTATLYFDADAGRFVESEIKQSLTSETPYRDNVIRTTVESTMRMTIEPGKVDSAE